MIERACKRGRIARCATLKLALRKPGRPNQKVLDQNQSTIILEHSARECRLLWVSRKAFPHLVFLQRESRFS